jgi:methylated-DNA-[protein]-cysteine S-methyltransferase
MKKLFYYKTSMGEIGIADEDGAITDLFVKGMRRIGGSDFAIEETEIARRAAGQLVEYLSGERECFDIPMSPQGTTFQKKVWKAISDIPYGETRTYAEVAGMVGSPGAFRAVGQASRRNPILIMIPCHRVVGSKGGLTGYAGGLALKGTLLGMESWKKHDSDE